MKIVEKAINQSSLKKFYSKMELALEELDDVSLLDDLEADEYLKELAKALGIFYGRVQKNQEENEEVNIKPNQVADAFKKGLMTIV